MKNLVLAAIAIVTVSTQAMAFEKDRGGAVVPFAKGLAEVNLSYRHTETLVTIHDEAAELIYEALKVEPTENTDAFAPKGQDVVKEKDNVRCLTSSMGPRTYTCLIRIKN